MGIINSIKKMFTKNIDCSEVLENTPFHFYSQKNRVVYVGANIIVKDGYEAVFVCNNKVTDVLMEGKHSIIASNLPKTFRRLRLLTAKDGKFASSFKVDIYFISVGTIKGLKFCSTMPYVQRSKRFGRVKAFAEGSFDLKIVDTKKFFKYLLLERPYILDTQFEPIMSEEVGNVVVEKLLDSDKKFMEILTVREDVYNLLNFNQIAPPFMGCEFLNVTLKSMRVPAKLEEKISVELEKRRAETTQINLHYGTNLDDTLIEITNKPVTENVNIENPLPQEKTPKLKKCISCGENISAEAKFCPNCGMRQNLF